MLSNVSVKLRNTLKVPTKNQQNNWSSKHEFEINFQHSYKINFTSQTRLDIGFQFISEKLNW